MRDRLAELGSDTVVAVVTFTDPSHLHRYREELDLPFPVLSDPRRSAYRAYGFGRGTFRRVYGLATLRRYVEILRAEGFGRLRRTDEDTMQLGGDIVIDPEGTLAWGYWGDGPADRPSIDRLVDAVAAAGARRD